MNAYIVCMKKADVPEWMRSDPDAEEARCELCGATLIRSKRNTQLVREAEGGHNPPQSVCGDCAQMTMREEGGGVIVGPFTTPKAKVQ